MKFNASVMGRIVALAIIGVVIAAVLNAAPLGVVALQDGEVETPTPSNDPDASDPYDCGDFETVEQLRAVYDPGNDVSDLDADPGEEPEDPDKIACEGEFPDQMPADTETETPTETEMPTETPAPTTTETPTETQTPQEETDIPTETPEEETETMTEIPKEETDTPEEEETDTPTETPEEKTPC
jgi:hypothetical protein